MFEAEQISQDDVVDFAEDEDKVYLAFSEEAQQEMVRQSQTVTIKLNDLDAKALHSLATKVCPHDKLGTSHEFSKACKIFEAAMMKTDMKALQKQAEEQMTSQKPVKGLLEQINQEMHCGRQVRFDYVLMLDAWGHKNGDEAALKRASEIMKEWNQTEPTVFNSSPELKGVLLQMNSGRKIDPTTANAEACVHAVMVRLNLMERPWDPSEEDRQAAVRTLAQSYMMNESATQMILASHTKNLSESDAAYLLKVCDDARKLAREGLHGIMGKQRWRH